MTDEERAREIVRAYYDCDRDWTLSEMLMALIMDVRADQREKCAKVADKHDTGDMQREDMEARRIAAAIRAMGDS